MKNRLEESRKIEFFFNKLYHLFFSEKFFKKINFRFDERGRLDLIKHAIEKNNYKTYLEIGCHLNEIFDEIKIEKVGVEEQVTNFSKKIIKNSIVFLLMVFIHINK